MKEHQAREYIFEEKVKKLLKDSGYISIVEKEVVGQCVNHDINAYATINIPTAFLYPIKMICQYKYYAKNKVELSHIRDFYGILSDINSNNLSAGFSNSKNINISNNIGCYFSATSFTRAAQEFAWSHNIFLMSLERIGVFKPILENINEFVDGLSESIINNISKEELLQGYSNAVNEEHVMPEAVVGIVNGTYPVLIMGNEGWFIPVMEEAERSEVGKVYVEQIYRNENQFEANFELMFMESVGEFSIPLAIVEKLMEREDNPTKDNVIFSIDIPYITRKGRKQFASMEVFLEGFERNQYSYKQITFETMLEEDNEE